MKSLVLIFVLIALVSSTFCNLATAATEQWRHELATDVTNIDFYVDQIVADGKGGCAVSVQAQTTDTWNDVSYYVAYYDKKGTKVWEKTYDRKNGEISYSNKKVTVIGLAEAELENQKVIVIDKKGGETVVEKPTAHIDGDVNSDIGPLGDKKGFFVVEEDIASGKISIVRYSYK